MGAILVGDLSDASLHCALVCVGLVEGTSLDLYGHHCSLCHGYVQRDHGSHWNCCQLTNMEVSLPKVVMF